MSEFLHFPKIPRAANIKCVITEKIDGTNAQIYIGTTGPDPITGSVAGAFLAGSRNRWIANTGNAADDNFGFARWADQNRELLRRLGPGRHFGEWWGEGIGRRYGLTERRFWLFDRGRWSPEEIAERGLDKIGVGCVPVLATCGIDSLGSTMAYVEDQLRSHGSVAVPGWGQPEGYVVGLPGGISFKVTDNGNKHKFQMVSEPCDSNLPPLVAAPLP